MDPFVGEIRTVGFAYAPRGWAMCDGQILPIAQNTALFSILGTSYGGDGVSTFALPNLNGSFAIGQGTGPSLSMRSVGDYGGASAVTLTPGEMPRHTHAAVAVPAAGETGDPQERRWAQHRYGRATRAAYGTTGGVPMAPDALVVAGGSAAHNNMPPFLVMNHVIALTGVFPQRP